MDQRLEELRRARREITASLKLSVEQLRSIAANPYNPPDEARIPCLPLLRIAEGLISAHMAARVDDDGYTFDLITDALRHVGKRLARETEDGRNFADRKFGADR